MATEDESEEVTLEASEPQPDPEPVVEEPTFQTTQATPEPIELSRDLYQPFSVGNIKQIDSTPDHKAPSKEDTIEGRYAGVLFTTASQNGHLYDVFEDMKYL